MRSNERLVAIQDLMNASGVRFGTSGVRGRVADLTREVSFAYTRAFLSVISVTSGHVALAMDLRPSSPEISAVCASAIRNSGLEVDFCGAIPTPALAYYAQTQGIPAIMVTGSHIPFDRNGIKFYGLDGEITKEDEANISRAVVTIPEEIRAIVLTGINHNAYQHYINRYLQFFPAKHLQGMRLGFYEHSCVGRDLLRELLERLGAEVISLGRTDQFVPIDTEAVCEADVQQARDWAEQYGFDAIISTDGDSDRPLLGDEHGNWFRGDVVGILCARYLGAQALVTTVSCNTVAELCGSFQRVVRTRIGSPHVIAGIEGLLDAGVSGVVGFEPNGGFLLGSRIAKNGQSLSPLLTRDATLPVLSLLSMAKENKCKVSALSQDLPARFTASDRIQNFPTERSRSLLLGLSISTNAVDALLADLCGKAVHVNQMDGLRITFENSEILHFRASGNAPELRCYAESASRDRSEKLVLEGLRLIQVSTGSRSI